MKRHFGRILLYGITLLIFFIIWIIYNELSYWIDRAPRDITAAINSNVNHLDHITNAVHRYYIFHNRIPLSLESMVNDPIGRQSWIQITTDPWGFKIGYKTIETTTNTLVVVWSYGSDNKLGGEWAAEDVIRCWSTPVTNRTSSVNP